MDDREPGREDQTPELPHLDLSEADLDVEPPAPARPAFAAADVGPIPGPLVGAQVSDDTLVIDNDDLLDLDDLPPVGPAGAVCYPGIDPTGPPPGSYAKKGKGDLLSGGLVGSLVLQMMLAGAIGGLLAWVFTEPGSRAGEMRRHLLNDTPLQEVANTAVFGAAMGGAIALALGAVEGLVLAAWSRAAAGAALGLLVGGAGGAFGGILGQIVFSGLVHSDGDESILKIIAARAIGWALVGGCVGLGPGIQMMAPRKLVNGVLGGAAGGLVGGFLFDPISMLLGAGEGLGGTPSRLIGIVVTGLCAGAGIGLVEEIRKEAWLVLISGPLAGKQFILYKPVTWIGSSPGMDIPLMKDPGVAPKQCQLEATTTGHILQDLSGGGTHVNGEAVAQRRLAEGDVIQAGHTGLQYCTRPFASGPYLP